MDEDPMTNFAALMMCDNRTQYTAESILSLREHLPDGVKLYLHDDSSDWSFQQWLSMFVGDCSWPGEVEILTAPEKRGFGGAIAAAWAHVYEQGHDFVFHTENDFTYNELIPLDTMSHILDIDTNLGQVALLRQPWNAKEKLAGGIIPSYPQGTFRERRLGRVAYLEHDAFWTTNPSLIPNYILGLGWPDVPESEGMFTFKLRAMGVHFGFLGQLGDEPRVTHIGNDRVGAGY
jgi:hypothetical protein